MTLVSMTGFADLDGAAEGLGWVWEARGVNGRGLDLRTRLPDGFEALEAPLRAALRKVLRRGSVTVGLRLGRGTAGSRPRLNPETLEMAIAAAEEVSDIAARRGLGLAPMTAADLMGLRGVMEIEVSVPSENAAVMAALEADIPRLGERLRASQAAEGAALARVIGAQLDTIAELVDRARASAGLRAARTGAQLRARIEALLGAGAVVDEGRLAQELAMIAVKADVTEELDRLGAHVAAARALLVAEEAVGRKLDFLTQEFNREANTLCSKAGAADLTAIGLEMKVVIDQMREQVQNVE